MSDFSLLPLEQLLHYCSPLTEPLLPEAQAAWHELQRRAFVEHSDAAWDALVTRLWSAVLCWLYMRVPEIAPDDAERLTQSTIWCYQHRQRIHLQSTSLQPLLPIEHQIQRCLTQLLAA